MTADTVERKHLQELLYDAEWVRRDHVEAERLRKVLHSPELFEAWVSGRLRAPSEPGGAYEIGGS